MCVCLQPYLPNIQCPCPILYCSQWHIWFYHIFPHQVNLYFFLSDVKCGYGNFLVDKSTIHIRVSLYWVYLTVLWLFHLGISCTVVVLTGFVMCGYFGNMCTCIFCVLYCSYFVFVLFVLCIFILVCFVCTSVRTTVTEWQPNCSQ